MTQQEFIPGMPEDFAPANARAFDQPLPAKPQNSSASEAMHREVFDFHQGNFVSDVPRVSDRAGFRLNAEQARQAIIQDLEAARALMLNWNAIARQGAGPNGINEATRRRQVDTLQQGLSAYERAQRQADQLLYQIDPQTGRPATSAHGEPIKSAFHEQLRREYEQLNQEINQLRNQNTAEARQALQQQMQAAENLSDLMRMSGYARANRGLALLFGCANLRGEDLINQRQAGHLDLMLASKYDPAMIGPPADRNFMRHFLRAQQVAPEHPDIQLRPPQIKPGPQDVQRPFKPLPVKPQEKQQPLPFKPPVKPGVEQTGVPGKPQVKPGDEQTIVPGRPSVNPAKPMIQPFRPPVKPGLELPPLMKPGQEVLPGKPSVKPASVDRMSQPNQPPVMPGADQIVQPAKPAGDQTVPSVKPLPPSDARNQDTHSNNLQIGQDGRRRVQNENYTLPSGNVVLNPVTDAQNRPLAVDGQPIFDSQGNWRRGADGQPVNMRLSGNDPIQILRLALAALSGNSIRSADRTAFRMAIVASDDLNRETLLARAQENQQAAHRMTNAIGWLQRLRNAQNSPDGPERARVLQALEAQLRQNQQLAQEVDAARILETENHQLEQIFVSSITTRQTYLEALLRDPDVQTFARLTAEQKYSSSLRQNVNVQEAQAILRQIVEMDSRALNSDSETGLAVRAAELGVRFVRPQVQDKPQPNQLPAPSDRSQPAKPQPGKPQDKVQTSDSGPLQYKPSPSNTITEAQDAALENGQRVRLEFMQQTHNGAQRMSAERWAQIRAQMDQLIAQASSVHPQTIDTLATALTTDYNGHLLRILQIPPEQLQSRRTDLLTRYHRVNQELVQAQAALPLNKQAEHAQIENNFQIAIQARRQEVLARIEQEAAGNQVRRQQLLAEAESEFDRWHQQESDRKDESLKALSPQLRAAMDAHRVFMSRPEAQITAAYYTRIEKLEQIGHAAGWLRLYYAQMLHMQGQTDAARLQMTQAVGDSQVAREIDTTRDGQALAAALNVRTPRGQEAQRALAADFPEQAPLDQAHAILADRNRDPHQAFNEACAKFEEAIRLTERRNVQELRAAAVGVRLSLESLVRESQTVRRPTTPEEVAALSQQADNLRTQMERLENQANSVAQIRYEYAIALSNYGFAHNNQQAKDKALATVEGIERVDPRTFVGSPEIQGALLQLRAGRRLVHAESTSELMVNQAANHITASRGVADILIPDSSHLANVASFGYAGRLPVLGPVLFGDQRMAQDNAIRALVQGYQTNAEATQRVVDQERKNGRSVLWNVAGDAAAVSGGLLTRYGLSRVPRMANGHWSLRLGGLAAQFAVAGLARDSVDGELGNSADWLRGAGMYGGSLLLMRGVGLDPTRRSLSAGTTEALASRYGMNPQVLQGATTRGVYESVLAQRALLNAETSALGVAAEGSGRLAVLNQQMTGRWNLLNYSPFSSHVWSAEAAAAALNRGEITLGQFWARQQAGSLWSVGGSSFLFGAGRDGLYIGTGQLQSDGSTHTSSTALRSMARSGGQAALGTLMLPFAPSLIPRYGPALVNRSGALMSAGLMRVGVPAVSAAGARYAMPEVSVAALSGLGRTGVPLLMAGVSQGNQGASLSRYSEQARGLVKMFDDVQLPAHARQRFLEFSSARGSLGDLERVRQDVRHFALEMSANAAGQNQDRTAWDAVARRVTQTTPAPASAPGGH